MYLKSLEINGFKSFADRTKLEFHPGVTGIVGPNGCGKSNVVDAIRWVLGETSARALRGDDMVDVIFNGTETRKALGMAEVQLTLTDCEAALQVDFHEISIGRRVYRDGKAEYLFNREPCRLRDIHDLFAGTGIGRTCYSIMQQGKIDQLLSSKPEDRRQVFEEAAGITKFKQQKREALRKLEYTDANLLRIRDVMEEQQRQISSLQRQASKARRYAALAGDLRVLDCHWSHRRYLLLSREREEQARLLAASREQLRAIQDAIALAQPALAASRSGLLEGESRIRDSLQAVAGVEARLASAEKQIAFHQERCVEWREAIRRSEAEAAALRDRIAAERQQLVAAGEEWGRRTADLQRRGVGLAAVLERLAKHRAARQDLEADLSGHQKKVGECETEAAFCRAQIESLTAQSRGQAERSQRLASLRQDMERVSLEKAEECRQIAVRLLQLREDLDQRSAELAGRLSELAAREQACLISSGTLREMGRQLAGHQARLEVLRQLAAAGEGLASGTRKVLSGLDEPERFGASVRGTLVACLQVEEEYLAAVEAALGSAAQAVLVEGTAAAVAMLEGLRDRKLGQAVIAVAEPGRAASPPAPVDGIDWLLDHVEISEAGRPVLEGLLGGIALVPDLAAAVLLRERHPGTPAVTRSGDFLSGHGILAGGFRDPQSASALRIQRNIRKLAQQVLEGESELTAFAQQTQQDEERVQASRTEVAERRERLRTAQAELTHLESLKKVSERDGEQIDGRRKGLEEELAMLEAAQTAVQAQCGELQAKLRGVLAGREGAAQAIPVLEAELRKCRLLEEQTLEQASLLRTEAALVRQSEETLQRQMGSSNARLQELEQSLLQRRSEIEVQGSRVAAAESESEELGRRIAVDKAAAVGLREAHELLLRQREARLLEIAEADAALARQRQSETQLTQEAAGLEVRVTQSELKLDHLASQVAERYQVDLGTFAPDPDALRHAIEQQRQARNPRGAPEQVPGSGGETTQLAAEFELDWRFVEESLPELRRKLDSLGSVNLDAIAEFEDLEDRFRLVRSQHEDLAKAREELLKIIARMNRTTREMFAHTFEQIAGNFRSMFGELFGRGSQADLVLLDEHDPLECGIDIIAKPPGKKLQSINLLSGGERSMTAVALLFAIYLVKPAPFCVLDELDAPLDDANIERFCRVLDRFCDQSQFVIVTHSKRTMHRADVLYGVSMEERGVSKTLSVKLAAAEPEVAS